MAALTEGVLVADEHGAIALSQPGGNPLQVIWPTGYATRDDGRRPALVDTGGRVIAHVGDRVQIGGGYTANEDGWVACDGTVVIVGG